MYAQPIKRILIAGLVAIGLATTSAPPASATTAYTVTILKVECIDRQEPWPDTNDEPRVEVNAMPVYVGSGYDDGTLKNIKNVDVTVYTDFGISVWEEDIWPDYDDYIGDKTIISADVVGLGTKTATIGTTDGKYKIYYKVEYK